MVGSNPSRFMPKPKPNATNITANKLKIIYMIFGWIFKTLAKVNKPLLIILTNFNDLNDFVNEFKFILFFFII